MSAGVFSSNDFSFNTAQAEPWANHDALQAIQLLGYILHGYLLAIYEMELRLYIIIYPCEIQTLANALVGILKVVLAYESDVHLAGGIALFVQEITPGCHCGCLSYGDAYLTHDGSIQSLMLHAHGDFIDTGHIPALHNAL